MAALFGIRGISGSTTTAGGLLDFMNRAGSDCEQRDLTGKALTVAEFNSFVSAAFTYASTGEKIALCGKNVMEIINGFAHEKLRVDMNVSKYGIRVMNYEASFGTLRLVYDKLFTCRVSHGAVLQVREVSQVLTLAPPETVFRIIPKMELYMNIVWRNV